MASASSHSFVPNTEMFLTPNQLAEVISKTITGNKIRNPKIINVHTKSLSMKGDMSFQIELNHWRGYVDNSSDAFKQSQNILQYYKNRYLADEKSDLSDNEILKILEQHVTQESKQISNTHIHLPFQMEISENIVKVRYERSIVSYIIIKAVCDNNSNYGNKVTCKKKLNLEVDLDKESEITNLKLTLLKKVSENLLKSQGYIVDNEKCEDRYLYTIKSEGNIEDYKKLLCGAILNTNKKKETSLTQTNYLEQKIEIIKSLNLGRIYDIELGQNTFESDSLNIANAAINYELLSCKRNNPIIIDNNAEASINSMKETLFILYNNARILAILRKYNKCSLINELPEVPAISDIKSFNQIDEESWTVIYNYVFKYSDVLDAIVTDELKFDININILWSFISTLCHDFSKYYRKNRILMKTEYQNQQIMDLFTERIYLVRAIRVILQNCFSLLEIKEVENM